MTENTAPAGTYRALPGYNSDPPSGHCSKPRLPASDEGPRYGQRMVALLIDGLRHGGRVPGDPAGAEPALPC